MREREHVCEKIMRDRERKRERLRVRLVAAFHTISRLLKL